MVERTYRVAVVGLGVGSEHIRHWLGLPDQFELVALCDSDPERLAKLTERHQLTGVAEFEELLRLDVDIIDVCTPPHLHFEMASRAMEAGHHVVCEKPLVNSLAEVDQLMALEERSGRRLMPISQYRFADGIQCLKHLCDQGLTGRAFTASLETHWLRGAAYYAAPWRGRWQTERGGVLLGHALHIHDLVCFILGDVDSVSAELATLVNPIETEDCAAVTMRMACGALVSSSSTLGSQQEISRLRFCFENFSVESTQSPYAPGRGPWQYSFADDGIESEVRTALQRFNPPAAGYTGQFDAFHRALENQTPLPVTATDARRALELVTAFYSSSQSGRREQLPVPAGHPGYRDWRPTSRR